MHSACTEEAQDWAVSFLEDLQIKHGESAADEKFIASCGWFNWFKSCAEFHNIEVYGEVNQHWHSNS